MTPMRVSGRERPGGAVSERLVGSSISPKSWFGRKKSTILKQTAAAHTREDGCVFASPTRTAASEGGSASYRPLTRG